MTFVKHIPLTLEPEKGSQASEGACRQGLLQTCELREEQERARLCLFSLFFHVNNKRSFPFPLGSLITQNSPLVGTFFQNTIAGVMSCEKRRRHLEEAAVGLKGEVTSSGEY